MECAPTFLFMTGNHKDTGITRRRALVVAGGTVAAGGVAVAGYQSAFADTTTADEATADTTSTGGACTALMSSVPDGPEEIFALEPYAKHSGSYTTLDDDMVYDGGGASSGLLTLKAVHKKDPSKGYKGFLTLGVDPDAETTGAGSSGGGGDGGTPPSGAPTGAPPSDAPTVSATAAS